jgi:hypothetical protein
MDSRSLSQTSPTPAIVQTNVIPTFRRDVQNSILLLVSFSHSWFLPSGKARRHPHIKID